MIKNILKILLILDLVAVNGGVGYLVYKSQTGDNTSPVPSPNLGEGQEEVRQDCDLQCQAYIDEKIKNYDLRIKSLETKEGITPAPTLRPSNQSKSTSKTKVRTVQYVTIPGSGSSSSNSWVSLSGTDFYFDPADYSGLVEVYFEANMKLFNGNGMAYVRLFDATHGIGVQGSEVSTNSQIETVVVSGRVTFWAGRNLIRVQAKSLTADTAIYSYGRLRVVTEN